MCGDNCQDPICLARKGCRWCGVQPVYFDINSLDPLDAWRGDANTDLQFDVEREREHGWEAL